MSTTHEEEKSFDIPFILGEETRPKIEMFTNDTYSVKIRKSIFYKQYCAALSGIAELVNYQKSSSENNVRLLHNNIFVFTGDRGSGKTSCMSTVKELLCSYEMRNENFYAEFDDINSELRNTLHTTTFRFFDTIDPTYFDCHHNILDLFIGSLFKNFQIHEKKDRDGFCKNRKNKDKLLILFEETKRNLSILNKTLELSEYDDLEQLSDLAASISFKQSLKKLVMCYIEYIYSSSTQLVLCIDDIDLNISEGYEMIEQVRKYMNIKGLVILMAMKIDQLENVIRIKYAKDFEPLRKQESRDTAQQRFDEIINEMVERYITKLFPINQRIQLPTVASIMNQSIGIFQYDKEGKPQRIDTLKTLKDGILRLIYKKIRMLAYNSRSHTNYIIPHNLRELLNLIHVLYNMKDASNHTMAIPNLLRFKDYFYGVWCANNLDGKGLVFMRNLQNVYLAPSVNQMVIRMLEERFSILARLKTATGKVDNNIRELISILDAENIMYNISLGDVLACLDWLDKVCTKEKDLKLIFAIKIFYSMYLYEGFRTYKEIQDQKKKFETETVNRELLTNNETDYGDILNGSFFNSEYINAAPYEKGEISRCRRVICGDTFLEMKKDNNDEIRKIADFFILSTAFVFDSKEKPHEDKNNNVFLNYRKKEEVYYEKEIVDGRKYVCFDVLSIFYNLLDIEKTYKRYKIHTEEIGKDDEKRIRNLILGMARKYSSIREYLEEKNGMEWFVTKEIEVARRRKMSPLYEKILKSVSGNLPSDIKSLTNGNKEIEEQLKKDMEKLYFWKEEKMLYRLNIRNVELLEQISYKLQRKRPNGNSNNIQLLKNMFNTLSEYKIKTYEEENIDYKFFEGISEFLDSIDKKDDMKNVFDNIYTEPQIKP